jgi:thiamine biosynthesis lipoprotein ApbE
MSESSIKRRLFGGEVEITIFDVEEPIAKDLLESTYEEGLRLQKIFNFYDKESELSKLNKERKIRASLSLLEVINTALRFCTLTGGKYDISLGKSIIQRKTVQKTTTTQNTQSVIAQPTQPVVKQPVMRVVTRAS